MLKKLSFGNLSYERMVNISIVVVSLAMIAYHMLSAVKVWMSFIPTLNIHLGFCLVLVFLSGLATIKGKKRLWNISLLIISIVAFIYIQILWQELQARAFFNTIPDLIIGALLLLVIIEAMRQTFGLVVPILVAIFVIYPFIGHYLPHPFYTQSLSLSKTIANLSIGLTGGIFGDLLSTSMRYVFLFVVFGGLLEATGGTQFFIDLAKKFVGKLPGGPALISVVSSCLIGSLSGAVYANISITGAFTIPLMKKAGYRPEEAGAFEAAASNGGQIVPPIMGTGAFVMSGMTNIAYLLICSMAIIPAILYYLCIFIYVLISAKKVKIKMGETEQLVGTRELLLTSPIFLVPLSTIIVTLLMGFSVMMASFCTIFVTLAVVMIRKKTRPSLKTIIRGLTNGAVSGAAIGISIAAVTPVVSSFTMTGIGVTLSHAIVQLGSNSLLLSIVLIWLVIILLGMGGLGMTAYIVISIFAVPALVNLGVDFTIAHFFVFFTSIFTGVTPPIAGAAILASKLAGASYMKTAWKTGEFAFAGLFSPFLFIYTPVVLLMPTSDVFSEIIRLVGFLIAVTMFHMVVLGFYFTKCNLLERILLLVGFLSLLVFIPIYNYLLLITGLGCFGIVTAIQLIKKKRLTASNLPVT